MNEVDSRRRTLDKRITTFLIIALYVSVSLSAEGFAAVRGDSVMYVGGTISSIPEKTKGKLDLSDTDIASFVSKKGTFKIPYIGISSIEYGQKAGRRVGVALAVNPLALFSKKRKHYVSVSFIDSNGSRQGIVLEVGKKRVHRIVETLEMRSGKTIEFESEEAQKHFQGR